MSVDTWGTETPIYRGARVSCFYCGDTFNGHYNGKMKRWQSDRVRLERHLRNHGWNMVGGVWVCKRCREANERG